jgi:transcriptional regulator with XRE-family HTH domain
MVQKTLAQKVDWLFDLCRTPQGRQYTYGQVQRSTNNRITASYVWKLRTGAMSNPGLSALEALADFFDVPLCYFAEGGEYLEDSIRLAHGLSQGNLRRNEVLRLVVERVENLSDGALITVLEMMEYLHSRDGRPRAKAHEPIATAYPA